MGSVRAGPTVIEKGLVLPEPADARWLRHTFGTRYRLMITETVFDPYQTLLPQA